MLTDRSSLGSGQRAPSSASWTVCGALSGNLPCFAVPTTLPCSLLPGFHFGGCSFSCLVFFMASILAGGVSSPSTRSSLRAALPQEAEQHQEDDHGDRHAEQPKENRHDLVPAGRSDVDGPNPGIGSFGNHATSARPHFVAIDRGDKAVSPLDGVTVARRRMSCVIPRKLATRRFQQLTGCEAVVPMKQCSAPDFSLRYRPLSKARRDACSGRAPTRR